MKHLTKNKPKPLIKVLGKPFLYYLLENFKRAGYKEFYVVVGYESEALIKWLNEYDPKIKIVNQFEILGDKDYGTACAIKCVKKYVGQENFIAMYGDNLYSPKDMAGFRVDDNFCYAGGLKHSHPEKYGVLITRPDGTLEKVIEKPKNPTTNLINCGFYKFTPEVFEAIDQVKLSVRGEFELTDAISILAKKGKMRVKQINDYWLDLGKISDIPKLTKFLRKNFKIK